MDKMILKDGTIIEFNYSFGLTLYTIGVTIDYLEENLNGENLSEVQFVTKDNLVYGKYNDLELISLSKNYVTKEITIELQESSAQ